MRVLGYTFIEMSSIKKVSGSMSEIGFVFIRITEALSAGVTNPKSPQKPKLILELR